MKVEELTFMTLFLEFAKKCLWVFVEWEGNEKNSGC